MTAEKERETEINAPSLYLEFDVRMLEQLLCPDIVSLSWRARSLIFFDPVRQVHTELEINI